MACMCGDLACGSCGPAQGADFRAEAEFDEIHEALTALLDVPCELEVPHTPGTPTTPRGADRYLLIKIHSLARLVDRLFGNEENAGLARVAEFIQTRTALAYNQGRADERNDRDAAIAEQDWWSLEERAEPATRPGLTLLSNDPIDIEPESATDSDPFVD